MTTCFNVKNLRIYGRPAKNYYAICMTTDEWEVGVEIGVHVKTRKSKYDYDHCEVYDNDSVEIVFSREGRKIAKMIRIKPIYEEIDFEGEGEGSHD